MYRKILIPVDLSERHAPVFELARGLLSEAGTLILLHVVEPIDGARDAEISNFYERIEVFWSLRNSGLDQPADTLDRSAWQAYWAARENGDEIIPGRGPVRWAGLPATDRALHQHWPIDYALERHNGGNPAQHAASDGRDAGMDLDLLPQQPPAEPVAEPDALGPSEPAGNG